MKFFTRLLVLVLVMMSGVAIAQPLPCPPINSTFLYAGPDTTICPGKCVKFTPVSSSTLKATNTYIADTIPYYSYPHGTGTAVSVGVDDIWSSVINLPFPFCFFGNKYYSIVIGSNGNISFNTNLAGTYNSFPVTSPIPNNYSSYNNCIMAPFFDMEPTLIGHIRYASYGVAPCRVFVVNWDSVATFSCASPGSTGCQYVNTQQVVLYESTYAIDINVQNHVYYTGSTSSGNAVLGIQNASATQAYSFPGHNNAQWNESLKSYRFTPNAPANVTYTWTNLNNNTFVAATDTVTVCPTVTTKYLVKAKYDIQCDSVVRYDTVKVTMGGGSFINNYTFTDPTTCGASDGTITVYGLDSNHVYAVKYFNPNQTTVTYSTTSTPVGTITIAGLKAGIYDSIIVLKDACPSNTIGPVTLTDPPITADYSYVVNYSCIADTVLFTNLSATPGGNLTYRWSFGDNTIIDTATNPAHVYHTQNTFNAQLIITNGLCYDTTMQAIDLVHPLAASFTVDDDSICQHQTVNFSNTSITTTRNGISPSYYWDFGDGDTSTAVSPTHTFDKAGTFMAIQYVKDFVPCIDTAYHIIQVDSTPYLNIIASDSFICAGTAISFTADYLKTGLTGFVWDFGDGYSIANINPLTHSYDNQGQYTVNITASYRICPDISISKSLLAKPFPVIDLGPDTSICPNGAPIELRDVANKNPQATYKWNTGETADHITVRNTGIYAATLTLDGCSTADSVEVHKNCYIEIPNSFSPNGDGITDYFLPRQLLSRGATKFSMTIFNRWGEKVFETTSIDGRGWDGQFNGTVQPSGVYIYLISITFTNGVSEKYQGNVTLLR